MVTVISFGYDVAEPPAAEFVLDVRAIPGSVVDGLWDRDGRDKVLAEKILATDEAEAILDRFRTRILPEVENGDRIAVGCSIGVHRSVAIAREIARELRDAGLSASVEDRDLAKRRDTTDRMEPMSSAYEVRAVGGEAITFSEAGGRARIDARAIKFDSWSVDLGGFRERIMPGSITLDADMVALFDHDTSKVLGRTSAGTMEVRSDSDGFAFTAYPPETTWANDLRVSMTRGDIKGCSFRMMVDKDEWYVRDGQVLRDVLAARVVEFTVTSMPAYPETTAEARDHAAALAGKVEDRAGRVLSSKNEDALDTALGWIEAATETIKAVVSQVKSDEDTDPTDDLTDSEGPDGASDASREAAGGASATRARTFVPGFGFINLKGK